MQVIVGIAILHVKCQMTREPEYSAIPTTYRSVNYRSRLEARVACFLDLHGMFHDYEPVDLDRYTPDFLVDMPHGTTLVECKPLVTPSEARHAARRVTRAGWVGPAIILGSRLCNAPDGYVDLTMYGSTHAELGGWSRVGRGRWPEVWGEYPFSEVWTRWQESGGIVQWRPQSSS